MKPIPALRLWRPAQPDTTARPVWFLHENHLVELALAAGAAVATHNLRG